MDRNRPHLSDDTVARQRDLVQWLEQSWRDLEALLQVTITVHDLTGAFRSADGESVLAGDRTIHAHPYCRQVHDQRCLDHCLYGVNARAGRRPEPQVHRCWKGAVEVAAPLLRDGVHLATLFIGVFRESRRCRPPRAARLPAAMDDRFAQLPSIETSRLLAIGRSVAVFARGLLERLEADQRSTEADVGDRAARIRRFIRHRAGEALRLADLARHLELSPSRASHVVRECCGCAFNELLQQERLERARVLLATSSRSVAEIAEAVGYESVQHFGRAFRRTFGEPPGRWRRQPKPR